VKLTYQCKEIVLKKQNLLYKMAGFYCLTLSVTCYGMWDVRSVSPAAGQSTWLTVAKLGAISDETNPIPVFNSDQVGGVITISQAGNYQLVEDITYPIVIAVSSVYLDLNTYKVLYTSSASHVVTVASGVSNVAVFNGYIQNTGDATAGAGVYVGNSSSQILLQNLTIYGCLYGVYCAGTSINTINELNFSGLNLVSNGIGMMLNYANANIISDCTALGCTTAGFQLNGSQANCFYDCTALKTTGTATVAGFKSTLGTSNMFQRCVVKQTKTNSTTFGDKACGFLLTSTEQKTKIVDCIVNETDVSSSPTAVTFGMQLAPVLQPTADLLSTVTLWTNMSAEAYGIAWSPNNDYLAIAYRSTTLINIYKFEGTGISIVTSITPAAQPSSIAWSPDGKYLVIGLNAVSNNVTVYSFNGQALTLVNTYAGGAVDPNSKTFSTVWSPNGKYIAYTNSYTGYVGILSFDGSSLALVSFLNLSVTTGSGYYVSWAPDGSALAVAVDNTGKPLTVIPVNTNGYMGTAVQLSTGIKWDSIKWSPNGKYFAVAGDSGSNPLQVYRWLPTDANPIAPAAPAITSASTLTALVWSPDGNYIAVGTGTTSYVISVYRFNGTSLSLEKTATQTLTADIRALSWSADGRYIVANDSASAGVMVILSAMYGPLNCLIDNCRVCDTLASNMNMGRGLVMGGTNVCTRTVAANNGVNYSYGIPNVYDGRFEIARNVVQPFDNVSMPSTL
jgi:Tol biopolymer transport system component